MNQIHDPIQAEEQLRLWHQCCQCFRRADAMVRSGRRDVAASLGQRARQILRLLLERARRTAPRS